MCLQYIGIDDINLNGTLIALSELFGMVLTIMQKPDVQRLVIFKRCFTMELIIAFLLFIFNMLLGNTSLLFRMVSTILVCCIRILNSVAYFITMIYVVEIFETKNRMIGISASTSGNFVLLPFWLYL